jgi:peptidoglycan/LPS O-acetylase OafA/YrhL
MYTCRRLIVMLFAAAIIAVAVANLVSPGNQNHRTTHYVGSAIVLALAVFGFIGALILSHRMIKWFAILLAAVWIYLLVYTIINLVDLKIGSAFLDVALMVVTFFGILVAADLAWATRHHDSGLSVGGPVTRGPVLV